MSSATTQIRCQINNTQARCDSLRADVARLEDELDRLYQARNYVTNAINEHEQSCANTVRQINSYAFGNRAARSYVTRMTQAFTGFEKNEVTNNLSRTRSEADSRISQVQQEIEAKRAGIAQGQRNIASLRSDLVRAQQAEAR